MAVWKRHFSGTIVKDLVWKNIIFVFSLEKHYFFYLKMCKFGLTFSFKGANDGRFTEYGQIFHFFPTTTHFIVPIKKVNEIYK